MSDPGKPLPPSKMAEPQSDEALIAEIRLQLDHHAEVIDAATASRLHQARNRAVAAASPPSLSQRLFSLLAPASHAAPSLVWGGLASAAVLAIVLIKLPSPLQRDPLYPEPPAAIASAPASSGQHLDYADQDPDALALLASNDDLDLYQDIDFYMWLSARTPHPPASGDADTQSPTTTGQPAG